MAARLSSQAPESKAPERARPRKARPRRPGAQTARAWRARARRARARRPRARHPGARRPRAWGSTRRALLTGSVAGAAGLALGTGAWPAAAATAARARTAAPAARDGAARDAAPGDGLAAGSAFPGRPHEFVTTRGGSFSVGGAAWRFGGTNTYYLHQLSHYMIDTALNDAAAMSLSVVRAWAFADGSDSYTAFQPQALQVPQRRVRLPRLRHRQGGQLGLRLVLALTNNWPDYGGMAQYVTWFLGLPNDSNSAAVNHDMFYRTRSIKDCYRAYAHYVATRVNRYTGLRYNQDPTIMTFELANEPRNRSDKTGPRC